jgi:hypothetical protein
VRLRLLRAEDAVRSQCHYGQVSALPHAAYAHDLATIAKVVCGCRAGPVLASDGWLVDECGHDGPARNRCPGDSDLAAGQPRCADAPFGSRQPIHQRAIPETDSRPRCRLFDEPPGRCLDNAAVERLFSSFEIERTGQKTHPSRDEAKADVFDYIERFYSPKRQHSTIGYLKPDGVRTQSQIRLSRQTGGRPLQACRRQSNVLAYGSEYDVREYRVRSFRCQARNCFL